VTRLAAAACAGALACLVPTSLPAVAGEKAAASEPAATGAKAASSPSESAKKDSVGESAASSGAPAGKAAADKQGAGKAAAEKAGAKASARKAPARKAAGDKGAGEGKMTLQAGQEGTAFGSLTVEGEDKIRIDFERPALDLQVDPRRTQGLELGDARQVLDRESPDLVSPFLAVSAFERSPYLGRPWLDELSAGPVARFRPAVQGVERWRLVVADSRGESVAEFSGQGRPPEEITWDGKTRSGRQALPGLTYSYVFEAFDRAGNKRNFVGEGFRVPPYRRATPSTLLMLFSGEELPEVGKPSPAPSKGAPPAVVLEVASWINQLPGAKHPVRIRSTARSFELASGLTESLVQQLAPLVLGDPARIQALHDVQPDAPAAGTVAIMVGP
jgi:hypothetical protein